MDMNPTVQNLVNQGLAIGLKVLGAIALWVIGAWLIGLAMRVLTKSLERQRVDTTHIRYIVSGVTVLLKVVLIVSILGYFGIQTTTFAALIAAIGIAIGAAWGGLLANLAAGAFLIFLKPFKVGDLISAAGILGTVREVGLFVTSIDTLDNIRTYVGNNKLFSDNIQNFTTNPFRRVDLVAQLSHGTDHRTAIRLLKERLVKIPNVLSAAFARCGNPSVQSSGSDAGRSTLLPQRPLLAGLFRYEPFDPRIVRRGWFRRPGTAPCCS